MIGSAVPSTVVQRLPLAPRRTWQPVDRLTSAGSYTQGALALSYPLPTGIDADPRPTALVVVPHGPRPAGPVGTDAWAATFIQAVVEVIASDRPLTQLIRWTSKRVYADIAKRQQIVARHRDASAVRSSRQHVATVRVSQPLTGCAEVAARITTGNRSRAVAARLDYVNERWVCTAIQFG